jgi:hypothetical protein
VASGPLFLLRLQKHPQGTGIDGGDQKFLPRVDDAHNVVHLAEPSYHGNPIGDGRSLVTIDWGYDICEHIFQSSGLFTQIIHIDDIGKGIRAEYIEVLVTRKPLEKQSDNIL